MGEPAHTGLWPQGAIVVNIVSSVQTLETRERELAHAGETDAARRVMRSSTAIHDFQRGDLVFRARRDRGDLHFVDFNGIEHLNPAGQPSWAMLEDVVWEGVIDVPCSSISDPSQIARSAAFMGGTRLIENNGPYDIASGQLVAFVPPILEGLRMRGVHRVPEKIRPMIIPAEQLLNHLPLGKFLDSAAAATGPGSDVENESMRALYALLGVHALVQSVMDQGGDVTYVAADSDAAPFPVAPAGAPYWRETAGATALNTRKALLFAAALKTVLEDPGATLLVKGLIAAARGVDACMLQQWLFMQTLCIGTATGPAPSYGGKLSVALRTGGKIMPM